MDNIFDSGFTKKLKISNRKCPINLPNILICGLGWKDEDLIKIYHNYDSNIIVLKNTSRLSSGYFNFWNNIDTQKYLHNKKNIKRIIIMEWSNIVNTY